MIEIIPAFLEKDYMEIERKASSVRGLVSTLQLDVMDGVFVPETSWPYEEGRQVGFGRLMDGEVPLPFWEDFNYEIDLMIENPEEDIPEWVAIGASRVIVHVESSKNIEEIANTYGKGASELSALLELGLALGTQTPNTAIEPYVDRAHVIQFMGIREIGAQGRGLDEDVFEKVSSLRAKYPDVTISVDGGVTLENAPRLIAAGADRLVSGSAIWKGSNPKEAIEKFKSLST